ncbi:hypothetical protein WISP_105587 [Willisornis vidua]|uniref:Cadherin domain-containing protein n=1 Tax=Willisornis vidua TaxID=1566151 RepID=A0ABQ9D2F1_9PASS|nr:hypothetical protein WISP_105587 [Willisornis vidua]
MLELVEVEQSLGAGHSLAPQEALTSTGEAASAHGILHQVVRQSQDVAATGREKLLTDHEVNVNGYGKQLDVTGKHLVLWEKIKVLQVIRSEVTEGAKFRLSGKGVDQDPKGIFRINEITGDVSVTRTLDREAIANYELEVEVTDLSGKTIDGPVRLDIFVIDQNDNRPMFKEGPYVGHVMEGSATGEPMPMRSL